MWQDIVGTFENLTPQLWVSQICGLIGFFIIGISYLFKKKKFLAIASISFIFFILEQIFAGLYSNLIVSSICLVRNLAMLILLMKKDKELPIWFLALLLGIMWGLEMLYMGLSNTFGVWDNYLPPFIVTMSTVTQNNKNDYIVKIGSTLHETGFLIYYIIYSLPFSILRQVILVLSAIIGILLMIVRSAQNRKTSDI